MSVPAALRAEADVLLMAAEQRGEIIFRQELEDGALVFFGRSPNPTLDPPAEKTRPEATRLRSDAAISHQVIPSSTVFSIHGSRNRAIVAKRHILVCRYCGKRIGFRWGGGGGPSDFCDSVHEFKFRTQVRRQQARMQQAREQPQIITPSGTYQPQGRVRVPVHTVLLADSVRCDCPSRGNGHSTMLPQN